MKKELIEIKQELNSILERLEVLLNDPAVVNIDISPDDDWIETAGMVYNSFKPRVEWFTKSLNRIIDKVARNERIQKRIESHRKTREKGKSPRGRKPRIKPPDS